MTIEQAPDGTPIEFPDDMTEAERLEVMRREYGAPDQLDGTARTVDDVVRAVAEGASFGWADEAAAAGDATVDAVADWWKGTPNTPDWSDRYDKNLARESAQTKVFADQNPGTALTANLTSGVATGGLGAAKVLGTQAVRQAPRLVQWLTGGAVGTAEGAIAGAGTADPNNRTGGAAQGALWGGAIGTAAPPLVGAIGRRVVEPIAARVSKAYRGGSADDYLRQAAAMDKNTLGDVAEKMGERGAPRVPVTPADTGPHMAGLGMHAAQRPGEGLTEVTDFFAARKENQFSRIMSRINEAIAPARREVAERVEDSPAFREALKIHVEIPPRLLELLRRPSLESAWTEATRIAREGDRVLPPLSELLEDVQAGRITGLKTELLHYLKKGLDDALEPNRDEYGNLSAKYGQNLMREMENTRREFRSIIKDLNKVYGKNLNRLAADNRLGDAYKDGQDFYKFRDGDVVEKIMGRYKKGTERRAFQRGVADAVENRIVKRADSLSDASIAVARERTKLTSVFGKQGAALSEALKNEVEMMRTGNSITQGSQTHFRKGMEEFMDEGVDSSILNAASAGKLGLAQRAVQALVRPTPPSQPVLDEIARRVINPNPDAIRAAAGRLGARAPVRGLLTPPGAVGLAAIPGLLVDD